MMMRILWRNACLNAFDVNDPVYIVGVSLHDEKKYPILPGSWKIAPWLTADQARDRVKWCLKIFQEGHLSARKT
jgi:hypothetical protein